MTDLNLAIALVTDAHGKNRRDLTHAREELERARTALENAAALVSIHADLDREYSDALAVLIAGHTPRSSEEGDEP